MRRPTQLNFSLLNHLLGYLLFVVAFITYALTIEPTASFWDCGEFIAGAYKLQAPHPPGTPFFLLVGRLFSLLAGNDLTQVAYWVNMVSVVCSAGTILLLFWSITLLGLKLMSVSKHQLSTVQTITLLSAGVVGALAYTFSDSFWFSAVEAEVYAMSSLFTAFIFWAMLKWDSVHNPRFANQWLLLIAYVTGLSLGVHILNLLTIPALGLIFYFKYTKKISFWGIVKALVISGSIILFILIGVISTLPGLALKLEVFAVNTLGLPFNSGVWMVIVGVASSLGYGIYYTQRIQKVQLNTLVLAFTLLLVGYSSYGIIVVRAQYDTPINMNKPSEISRYVSYVNREQYGNNALFYGPTYESRLIDSQPVSGVYRRRGKRYERVDFKPKYVYDQYMYFPRIYSQRDNHPTLYRQILKKRKGQKPSMRDNLTFFWDFQLGHMYWRYFLWNFAGRESDIQDAGILMPHQVKSSLPEVLKRNKANNQFYMLPLLLGLIGAFFQYRKSKALFMINALLFAMLGLALVFYFNSPPVEPRERDYIYVGSFYAFAVWIGFGAMALGTWVQQLFKQSPLAVLFVSMLCMWVPLLMAIEGWNDHDRSNRVFSVNSAKNMLNSCAPDSILFVSGDNETYPLWYAQEVEGVRTDVRVCNLQLMTGAWYTEQLRRKVYQSDALPFGLDQPHYARGTNAYLPYIAATKNPAFSPQTAQKLLQKGMNLKQYFQLLKKHDARLRYQSGTRQLHTFPTQKLVLPINKESILKQGIIPEDKKHLLNHQMEWVLPQKYLYKDDLAILDLIAHNEWKRPIYFSTHLDAKSYLGLKEYLQMEGLVYRLLPVKVQGASNGYVNTTLAYKNLLQKADWTGLNNPDIYYDEMHRRMVMFSRGAFARLAAQLYQEGKPEKARKVALFCLDKMPDQAISFDYYTVPLIGILLKAGEKKRGVDIGKMLVQRADEYLVYLLDHSPHNRQAIITHYSILGQLAQLFEQHQLPEAKAINGLMMKYYQQLK
ncbi:glycosyltransferase family 117 protein [Microscilla marina]|uniref:Conserved n=1 Tax=Microscilla marina ATCC 23134 TaxID=313606 RepID=A1ZG62_MICM2|nr:DUF2723 domain-containing protein [Microscilla marina]EAY30479.1 conserved [Microscilla marina ATCC 23134]